MSRILELDPVVVLYEPDPWRRAMRLAAALEVSDEQKARQKEAEAKMKRKK